MQARSIKTLKKYQKNNFPEIIRLGDVNNYRQWDLPHIDLIMGGSPCQGFSRNGKMLNFEDPRSKLFFIYVEILEQITKKQGKTPYFLLENVCMKKEYRDIISQYLNTEPIMIDSRLVSAQARQRLYWTNILGVKQPKDREISLIDILEVVDTSGYIHFNGLLIDPNITKDERNLISVVNGEVRISQATKQGYIVAEDGDGVNLSFPKSKTRRGRVIKGKAPTLDCQCNICVYHNGIIRKATIRELERLQTLRDGYTAAVPENIGKKAIGNGWNVETIAEILKNIKEGG